MADAAPVSSRHVRIKLHNLAGIPERELDRIEITSRITKNDRAETTIERPKTTHFAEQKRWDNEMLRALRHLEGAESGVVMTMGRTFTVEWDGICRPI
jgi:hypothetical protein